MFCAKCDDYVKQQARLGLWRSYCWNEYKNNEKKKKSSLTNEIHQNMSPKRKSLRSKMNRINLWLINLLVGYQLLIHHAKRENEPGVKLFPVSLPPPCISFICLQRFTGLHFLLQEFATIFVSYSAIVQDWPFNSKYSQSIFFSLWFFVAGGWKEQTERFITNV